MSQRNKKRCQTRKDKGLCIHCGLRPQFWGVRCLLCRQQFTPGQNKLPRGLRRALQSYRQAEELFELEQRQVRTRFVIRKLLAMEDITGAPARALRLYAGIEDGSWRTYEQVGQMMHLSKERVRQLLRPSKIILTELLDGKVPWKQSTVPRTASEAKRKTPYCSVSNTRRSLNVYAVIATSP